MAGGWQEDEVRRSLNLKADAPLNHIVYAMAMQGNVPQMQRVANQYGLQTQTFKEYCSLFTQGLQWVHEKYGAANNYPGPQGLSFSKAGMIAKVQVLGCEASIMTKPQPDLNWITLEDTAGNKVVITHLIVPWDDMVEFQMHKADEGHPYKAKSRLKLGDLTMQEHKYLAGVEEAYHAIQAQDPSIAARLEAEQAALEKRVGNVDEYIKRNKLEVHDVYPRELDVVSILEKALADFRKKQLERDGIQ